MRCVMGCSPPPPRAEMLLAESSIAPWLPKAGTRRQGLGDAVLPWPPGGRWENVSDSLGAGLPLWLPVMSGGTRGAAVGAGRREGLPVAP